MPGPGCATLDDGSVEVGNRGAGLLDGGHGPDGHCQVAEVGGHCLWRRREVPVVPGLGPRVIPPHAWSYALRMLSVFAWRTPEATASGAFRPLADSASSCCGRGAVVIAELVMRSVSEVLRHLLAAIEHAGLDQESPGTGRQRTGACHSGGDAPHLPAHRGQTHSMADVP